MVRKVCVIGAGIIGLSSALRILESIDDVEVTIISENFSPYTTTDVAAGFWTPYRMGNTPNHLIKRWGGDTYNYLMELSESEEAKRCGVHMLSGYYLFYKEKKDVFWKDIVLHFRDLTTKELQMFPLAKDGAFFTSVLVTGSIYLPWAMSKFVAKGGRVKKRKVNSLSELTPNYDAIINCCGLGSYALLNDHKLNPIRGQVMRVKAPWLKHFVIMDRPSTPVYIFPTFHNVVMGGTSQLGNWNCETSEHDKKRIIDDCVNFVPSLKDPEIIDEYVGLRPFREETRLDKEIHMKENRRVVVINNYGHGGCGLSTFWGCAKDVVQLLTEEFSQPILSKL